MTRTTCWWCRSWASVAGGGQWHIRSSSAQDVSARRQRKTSAQDGLQGLHGVAAPQEELEALPHDRFERWRDLLEVGLEQLDRIVDDYVALMRGLATDPKQQDRMNEVNRKLQEEGYKTIASSVEDASSLAILWNISVNYIQGYFLQEPSSTITFDAEHEAHLG